jgi:hypothetical protein
MVILHIFIRSFGDTKKSISKILATLVARAVFVCAISQLFAPKQPLFYKIWITFMLKHKLLELFVCPV